ncbi:toprim domain-containing protein [Spirillospora sp. NPDC050679]
MTDSGGEVERQLAVLRKVVEHEAARLHGGEPAWSQWLDGAIRYGRYGFDNTLLIRVQRPDASDVRSFGDWKAAGRRVRKGETGIRIVAKSGTRSLFDVSQTTGPPLRQAVPCSPTEAWEALRGAAKDLGLYVDRGDRWHYTGPPDRVIDIGPGLDDAEAARVLAHQLAHALRRDDRPDRSVDLADCHGQRRVEADSAAYLLLGHLTGSPPEITFPRPSVWAGNDRRAHPAAVIRLVGERLLRTASQVRRRLPERPAPSDSAPPLVRAAAPHPRDPSDVTREELLAINAAAHAFYRDRLGTGSAHTYLESRGFPVALLEKWQIGYAPPSSPSPLVAHLRALRHRDEAIVASGLVVSMRDGTLRDRFRGRIVFAIRDAEGLVRGFIGRHHDGPQGAKYLNSPDSALFHKGELLLGLHEMRARLHGGARPVIVEGPLDAIAVNTASAGHAAVALCGTALTAAHVEALAAVGDLDRTGVLLALDGDTAGRAATVKSWPVLAQVRGPTGALMLADGRDPADVLRAEGRQAVRESLKAEVAMVDVAVDAAIERFGDGPETAERRLAAARSAISQAVLAHPRQAARQAARIVARTGVPAAVVTDLFMTAVSPESSMPARLAADGFPVPPSTGPPPPGDTPVPPSRRPGRSRSL